MNKSYLIDLIKTIGPNEWPDLKLFVSSHYHNRGANKIEVFKLLSLIEEALFSFGEEDLNKNYIYKILFPGKTYVNGKIDKIMAELNKIVRTFLLTKYYFREENNTYQNLDLAVILRLRGLENRYQQLVTQIGLDLEKEKTETSDYFYRKYLLEYEKHDWQSYYNREKGDLNIPLTIENLDLYYYINKFELLNRFLLQQMSTRIEPSEFIVESLKDIKIPYNYEEKSSVLTITYKIFTSLNSSQWTLNDFIDLSNLLNQHESKIGAMPLRSFFTYLRNICVLLFKSGMKEFGPLLFKLQKQHLERGYLYYNEKLSPSAFSSAVHMAILLGEYNWVHTFIENHKDMIIGESPSQEYYRLNLGRYYFAIKRFNDALDIIPQSFPESIYNNLTRRLELKIYYETNFNLLSYKIDSFKMLINRSSRKHLPPQEREYQNNFINLLFQLTQSPPKDQNRSERLIKRINAKKFVADREWLLEKAAELGKKK